VGAAGGMDDAEGCLNSGWERAVSYGDQAEFAEFEVDGIVGEGEALEVEDLVSSK
jgi:hypothetical protein